MSEQAYVVRQTHTRYFVEADGVTPWDYQCKDARPNGGWKLRPVKANGYERKGGAQPSPDINQANVVLRSKRSLDSYPPSMFEWIPVKIVPIE